MSRLVCGRCGHLTAPNSTYCSHDRWTLFTDIAQSQTIADAGILHVEMPRHPGFLTRRRHESHRAHLERQLEAKLHSRLEKLEAKLESDADNFETHRMMGLLSLLDNHWERANAHLKRAHELNPHDCQTHINYAIVLAQRGQTQLAIELLEAARQEWTTSPLVLFNLALIALQARRPQLAIDSVDALEHLWFEKPALLRYHDEALTARGLALLQLNRLSEARAALDAAARHLLPEATAPAAATDPATDVLPEMDDEVVYKVPGPDEEFANGDAPSNAASTSAAPEPTPPEPISAAELIEWESKRNQADFLNNLAIAEAASGDLPRAVAHLAAALRVEPAHTRVLNNLGVLAYQQGHYPLAVKYLETAHEIEEFVKHPEPATYNHLGVALAAVGRLDESLEQFQHAGTHERAEFEIFYNLGRAFIEHGKPQRGVEYLRKAFLLNPNQPDVHAVLGAAYLLRGQPELLNEALKYLKRAVQLNPHHRMAFTNLAMTMLELEDENAARLILRQALKSHPNNTEAIFLIALMTMDVGNPDHWEQASAQFSAALATRPSLIAALYNFALCQYMLGFLDGAALHLQQVTQRDASFAPAYYLLGTGHAVGKRFKQAIVAWQSALQYEPGNIDLHANMAFVYYKLGQFKEAVQSYMNAHRIDPTQAEILGALGVCFAQASRSEKDKREQLALLNRAITAFQQSLQINPHLAITHSNLGLAFYLQNQIEKAVDCWRTVAQLDAGYAERREAEQHRSYDDSIVSLRPLNWRARVIKLAPALPAPHTRLVPGYNARDFRPAITDTALQDVPELRFDLLRIESTLAWMNLRQ